MSTAATRHAGVWPDAGGHFGPYGGRYVPETLMEPLRELEEAYAAGLAGSWPRLRRGKHFPTDLLAGAIIGTAVGRSVVHYNDKLRSGEAAATQRQDEGVRLTVFPLVQGDGIGLAGTLRF